MIRREKVAFTLFCGLTLLLSLIACAAPPTPAPTATLAPTAAPTVLPTRAPTVVPTAPPTVVPTAVPTTAPTVAPTATATRTATAAPTTAPTTVATAAMTSASAATPATKPGGIASYLPAGPGRDLLFLNCGNCHSPLCPVIGQREVGHWERVKIQHKSEVSAMSDADYKMLLEYLLANFNDTKPEPALPAEMRQNITCAPF